MVVVYHKSVKQISNSYQFLPSSRRWSATVVVKNSQSLDRAITRESQTHDVDVCGAGKAYSMVAKGSAIINSEMQSWINAQRRYCAGPRLDCARDASLEHQQNHGAARKQGKSTLWILFFSLFFFALLFFAKNHYNGECLKTLPSSNWQDGHEIFSTNFFFRLPGPKNWKRVKKNFL